MKGENIGKILLGIVVVCFLIMRNESAQRAVNGFIKNSYKSFVGEDTTSKQNRKKERDMAKDIFPKKEEIELNNAEAYYNRGLKKFDGSSEPWGERLTNSIADFSKAIEINP